MLNISLKKLVFYPSIDQIFSAKSLISSIARYDAVNSYISRCSCKILIIALIWMSFGAEFFFNILWQLGQSFTRLAILSYSCPLWYEIIWWISKDCLPVCLFSKVVVVPHIAHLSSANSLNNLIIDKFLVDFCFVSKPSLCLKSFIAAAVRLFW